MRERRVREKESRLRPSLWTLALAACLLLFSPPARAGEEWASVGSNRDYTKTLDVGDPVSAGCGAYHFDMPLLALGGPMGLSFAVYYRSDFDALTNDHGLPYRFGWSPYAAASGETVGETRYLGFQLPDGTVASFKEIAGVWVPTAPIEAMEHFVAIDNGSPVRYQMDLTEGFAYLMDPVRGRVYIFEHITSNWSRFRIRWIADRNGNLLTFTYNAPEGLQIVRVDDGLGRSLDFTYWDGPWSYITSVTDQAGRQALFTYEAEITDNGAIGTLRSITDPAGGVTTLRYAGQTFWHAVASRTLPEGNTPIANTYASLQDLNGTHADRVAAQEDAYGNRTEFSFDPQAPVITETLPDESITSYEHYSHHSRPKSLTDAAGGKVLFGKNDLEQITFVTDALGDQTSFSYDGESGMPSTVVDAAGHTYGYTYASAPQTFTNPGNAEQVTFTFRDLASIFYPDGTTESFTYDGRGNLTSRITRDGRTWTYTHDAQGLPGGGANPEGGTTVITYNADGTVASTYDSDTGITTYAYDAFRRPVRTTWADGCFTETAYDPAGRIVSLTDENGNTTAYAYDANGNAVTVTDTAGRAATLTYDLLDRPLLTTDRLGEVTSRSYDSRGRLASVTDPNGLSETYGYDPRGWLDSVTRGGGTWGMTCDAEGVITSRTTPEGRVTSYETDAMGRITAEIDPLSNRTEWERDAMGRIVLESDPLNRVTSTSYSGDDRLQLVNRHSILSTYTYDGAGFLTGLTDPGGHLWAFGRTPMGRLASATDPLGNAWVHTYDSRGMRATTTFPDGGTLQRTRDPAGRVTRKLYSEGPDLPFEFDTVNGLTATAGISYARDAEGKVTSTTSGAGTFGATYDGGGRLVSVSHGPGLFQVNYAYDPSTGLLSRVSDTLTGSWVEFRYDGDLRLTGLTRSNGVNAAFTWDAGGRLTGIRDGTVLDLRYTYDALGRITSGEMDAPLDPADSLVQTAEGFSYDAASQVTDAGYAYDARGRLTASPGHTLGWDGASRLASLDGAAFAYSGAGDLLTRTAGAEATVCGHNAAIAGSPIVAEGSAGGASRFFVWTPGGTLLYLIDAAGGNAPRFYHFDVQGSTLALTDAGGAVTDAYAYAPYGALLRHEGTSDQPYTFGGRKGVRSEEAFYRMGMRIYDPRTARFLSREPDWPDLLDPRCHNPYQYAVQDPVNFGDRTGRGLVGFLLELVGIDTPDVPTSPADGVLMWLEGTPTGYQYGDPEWGYGSPQEGFVSREQHEERQRQAAEQAQRDQRQRERDERVDQLRREHQAYLDSDEYKEWKKRDEMIRRRDKNLLWGAVGHADAFRFGRRRAPEKARGVWVLLNRNSGINLTDGTDWAFFENARILGHWESMNRVVLDVGNEEGPLWIDGALSVREDRPPF